MQAIQTMSIAALIAGSSTLIAQNLVLNPGFEENTVGKSITFTVGASYFDVYGVRNWIQPTQGSSDYYYKNIAGGTNMLQYGGKQDPASGNALVGFIAWVPGREYREYTEGVLSAPLVAGQKYKFSLKICAGTLSPYLVNDLGVHFSKEKVNNMSTDKTMALKPQVWLDATAMHTSPEQWITLENVFTATGGERYFTIGNFLNDSLTIVTETEGNKMSCPYAYFYMDDIAVAPTNDEPTLPYKPTSLAKQIAPGKTFIARGINFDLDKSTLRPESYLQLHEIAAELKHQPGLKVDIRGYTDSSGSEQHNLQLSKSRAKVVADYLISIGIDRSRITYDGYGSKEPVSAFDPALNRRVEFVFR